MLSLNHHRLHIETLIMMKDTCPISYNVDEEHAEFIVGGPDESFEFTTTAKALDNLIAIATEAREAMNRAQLAADDED